MVGENIRKGHALSLCHFCHRVGVELDLGVEMLVRLLSSGGAHEDDFRLGGAVVAMALQLDQEGPQQRLELGEAVFAFEALVEAKGGEDDVRLVLGEVLVEIAEAIRPRAEGDFIGGPA